MSGNDEAGAGRIDSSRPHPARRYDYWLGGKDNFQADRDAAESIAAVFPHIRTAARENRAFMQRAVRFLAAEAGIRQFLDIGTGLPTANNVHDVAQRVAPESRIVYVDNDPLVLTHARALLTSSEQGATAYIDADARDPEKILNDPAVRDTLDWTQPVALLLVAVLHFVADDEDPYAIVSRLVGALPPGSYLVLSHATFDPLDPGTIAALDAANSGIKPAFRPRPIADYARFFDGLELLDPGIVSVSDWRPDPDSGPRPTPAEATGYGAVARTSPTLTSGADRPPTGE
ncbi:SAM-dependent methyltransferase [Micromonosporaceae bacterium Da 78-11]